MIDDKLRWMDYHGLVGAVIRQAIEDLGIGWLDGWVAEVWCGAVGLDTDIVRTHLLRSKRKRLFNRGLKEGK